MYVVDYVIECMINIGFYTVETLKRPFYFVILSSKMPTHKSNDYKLSAVLYYLENNDTKENVCNIFKCSRRSLSRWIEKYQNDNIIERKNRTYISYKIRQEHVNSAIDILRDNQQLSMDSIVNKLKDKHNDFDITPQWLNKVIRDNNFTRKRTKRDHYPEIRYGIKTDLETDLKSFYTIVKQYPLDRIITLDETSLSPFMIENYSRCKIGQRCYVKSSNNIVFQKFTLILAISNKQVIGWTLYEKGGMTSDRLVEFLHKYVVGKYKNHLIIMDNAGSHKKQSIKDAVSHSENRLLYSIPYKPQTNSTIENCFSQLKHHIKFEDTLSFDKLKNAVEKSLKKITKQNLENYFQNAYGTRPNVVKKKSTRLKQTPIYKK